MPELEEPREDPWTSLGYGQVWSRTTPQVAPVEPPDGPAVEKSRGLEWIGILRAKVATR